MENRKFKLGDKVVGNSKARRYHITKEGWTGEVIAIEKRGMIRVSKDGLYESSYIVDEECFDLDGKARIFVYSDGKTTYAQLKKGDETIKEAKAKCHPDDEFDFDIGAKLACERLLESEQKT